MDWWITAQQHCCVFSWAKGWLDVRVWPAVCVLGVVTLTAGPLEPLSGVLYQIIIKPAPFDLPSLLLKISTLPLCKLREAHLCLYAMGLETGNSSEVLRP